MRIDLFGYRFVLIGKYKCFGVACCLYLHGLSSQTVPLYFGRPEPSLSALFVFVLRGECCFEHQIHC